MISSPMNEFYFVLMVIEQDGRTALHQASRRGHFEVCKWLVTECGCDPAAVKDNVSVFKRGNS